MTLRKTGARLVVASALALPLFAPPAHAAKDRRIDGKYGFVTFKAYGEVIEAADIYEDGYGVRAYLRWKGGSAKVSNYGKLYPVPKNLSIREGRDVYLRMCYTNNGHAFNCSGWQRGEA